MINRFRHRKVYFLTSDSSPTLIFSMSKEWHNVTIPRQLTARLLPTDYGCSLVQERVYLAKRYNPGQFSNRKLYNGEYGKITLFQRLLRRLNTFEKYVSD